MEFSQEQLEAAYKQMAQARSADAAFAQQAAAALEQCLLGKHKVAAKATGPQVGCVKPSEDKYVLVLELSQHDNWHETYKQLVDAGVSMAPWKGNMHSAPHGRLDLSASPSFNNRATKDYAVRIDYYDGGY